MLRLASTDHRSSSPWHPSFRLDPVHVGMSRVPIQHGAVEQRQPASPFAAGGGGARRQGAPHRCGQIVHFRRDETKLWPWLCSG